MDMYKEVVDMTFNKVYEYLREGKLMELYEEGCLDVGGLRMAVDNGWIDVDTATSWYEVLMDI